MRSDATIVGAGVEGLAAAVGLQRLGWEVTVLERAAAPRQDGAGLTLWPNALRALDAVGAGATVDRIGAPARRMVLCRADGSRIAELPVAALTARHGPMIAVLRTELTQALTDQLSVPVRYGTSATVVDGTVFMDGQPARTTLLIGADGIDSAVREAVVAGIHPRFAGQFAARGVAQTGAATPTATSESWGRGLRFGLVPLRHGLTYWFAATTTRAAAENPQETFARWHQLIADVLDAPQVGRTPVLQLRDLPRLRTWHDRRSTVLVGDAAHAMTPNLGQGAAQALEDVALLLGALKSAPVPEALAVYEHRRKRRAEQIVRRSMITGRIAQASNPVTAVLRDMLARGTPDRAILRQYEAVLKPTE